MNTLRLIILGVVMLASACQSIHRGDFGSHAYASNLKHVSLESRPIMQSHITGRSVTIP